MTTSSLAPRCRISGRSPFIGVSAENQPQPATLDGRLLDQFDIDWFHEMNRAMHDLLDNPAFEQRIRDNVLRMEWLAAETLQRARDARRR